MAQPYILDQQQHFQKERGPNMETIFGILYERKFNSYFWSVQNVLAEIA